MSFSQKISQFAVHAIDATEDERKGISEELFSSAIMDTPVDEGRLRGSWMATNNKPATGTTDKTDKEGSQTVNKAVAVVQSSGSDEDLYLTNNLPYAARIEYGYSDKAPEGMVRKNIVRITSTRKNR